MSKDSRFVWEVGENGTLPFTITKQEEKLQEIKYTYCQYRQGKPRVSIEICEKCETLECQQNPKHKGVKEMGKVNGKDTSAVTMTTVMEKLQSIEEMIKNLTVSVEVGGPKQMPTEAVETRMTGKRKLGKKEKDALKAELLKNGPYGAEGLVKLGTKKCCMLASGMHLNAFGKGVDEVAKMILDEEAKRSEAGKGKKEEKPKKKGQKKTEKTEK